MLQMNATAIAAGDDEHELLHWPRSTGYGRLCGSRDAAELEKAEGGVDEFLTVFDRKGRCTDRWSFPMVADKGALPAHGSSIPLAKTPCDPLAPPRPRKTR